MTVDVQAPDTPDPDVLTARLPRGRAGVRAVSGGMNMVSEAGADRVVIAQAAAGAFLPPQTGWTLKG